MHPHAAPLGAVAREGSSFVYRYDLGDCWDHEVRVERVTDGDETFGCTGGARACPPEDCGGAHGYAEFLAALRNPEHEDHSDMKRWASRGFDAEKFDVNAVNKKLAALSKRLGRRRSSGRR